MRAFVRPAWGALLVAPAFGEAACAPPGDVVVIWSQQTPRLRPRCAGGGCAFTTIEELASRAFRCERSARVVIVSGHAMPPEYLGRPARDVARAVACHHPELVVVDACYGASLPILAALVDEGVTAQMVAPTFRLPDDGFAYGPAFFAPLSPETRAAAVTSPGASWPVSRFRLDGAAVGRTVRAAATMSAEELRPKLRHVVPNYAALELEPGVEVLAEIPVERFR